MATKLIRLTDGTLVEAEVPDNEARQISGGAADRVDKALDTLEPVLLNACKPVIGVWKSLRQEVTVSEVNVELGLSFEGEGNLYITKAKAGANLTVKLVIKPGGDA